MAVFIDEDDLKKSAQIIEKKIRQKTYERMKQKCAYNTVFYYETFEKGTGGAGST